MLALIEALNDPLLVFRHDQLWTDGNSIRKDINDFFQGINVPPRGQLSISHSPSGGAWVYSKKGEAIGIDVESKQRIQKRTVARVSSELELQEAPQPAYIWTGKEAVFKSLWPNNSNLVISHIRLKNWSYQFDIWRFEAELNGQILPGLGACFEINDMALACFLRDGNSK